MTFVPTDGQVIGVPTISTANRGVMPANPVGRYSFEHEPHGEGGFGRVLKGRDNVLERDVALKMMNIVAENFDESDRQRFLREAKILASFSFPNIPAIYDVVFSEKQFYIIFEFVDGKNLAEVLETEGPVNLGEAKQWLMQIATALEYAHARGVVHRDVKPGNIIVTPQRTSAYLVDFGIAFSEQDTKRLTDSGFAVGTAGYMSPEQRAGKVVDGRADIYSLGVTLYEVLAGHPIPIGVYQALSLANEAIPPEIDQLIQDCLLPAEHRVASPREFLGRLEGALRPVRPLSEILTHGRLHELAAIIEDLTPSDFIRLPKGQQALILAKVNDVVLSGDPGLQIASERFLQLLVERGLLLPKDQYREIVRPALTWGFELQFGSFIGRPSVRRALEEAALSAGLGAHDVIREEFVEFLSGVDLESKDDWYLHAVRTILTNLLANPECVEGTRDLVILLNQVNKAQRERMAGPSSSTRSP